jgi:hypothetical protein
MKKILILLFSCINIAAAGQNLISPITITLPANPPAKTADWATAMPPVMITASAKLQNGRIPPVVVESRILVTIKSGGNKVCGTYTTANAPMANFNTSVKNWSGPAVLSLLGQDCTLPPGSYELCVQFYGLNAAQGGLLGESCKPFTIPDKKQETYSPPQNVLPADGKEFTKEEARQPVNFRWTPVVPKPKAKVKYTVRIWEVPKGGNKNQVIKTEAPFITKETEEQTQLTIPASEFKLSKRCTGCEIYIWDVQASKKTQMGDVEMLGTSEATSFMMSSGYSCSHSFQINVSDSVCLGTEKGKNKYRVCINSYYSSSSVNLTYTNSSSGLAAYDPSNPSTYFTISNLTPLQNQPGNGSMSIKNYCFDVEVPVGIATIRLRLQGDDKDPDPNNICQPGASWDLKLPKCPCVACDAIEINAPLETGSFTLENNKKLHFNVNLGTVPKKVQRISADLIYYKFIPSGPACIVCNKTNPTFAGFEYATTSNTNLVSSQPYQSSVKFEAINPMDLSSGQQLSMGVAIPELTGCCDATINFCIRYTITYDDCTTCNKMECYGYEIKGCKK